MQSYLVADIFDKTTDTLGHLIYLVRDSDLIFYIGQSKRDVRTRFHEHLQKPTTLGQLILANNPASQTWQVDFYTLADCRPFIQQKTLFPMQAWEHFDMDMAEKAMIQALRPVLNKDFNPNPTTLPDIYKKIENAEQSQAAPLLFQSNPKMRIWLNKMSLNGWSYRMDAEQQQVIWQHTSGKILNAAQIAPYQQAGTLPPLQNE